MGKADPNDPNVKKAKARNAAVTRLTETHGEEFAALLDEEMAKEGFARHPWKRIWVTFPTDSDVAI